MSPWYVPSIVPVVGLSALLAGLVLWRDRRRGPIAAYGLAITAWAFAILLAARPETRAIGERGLMVGFFVPATFLHVAAVELGWDRRAIAAVYLLGAGAAVSGALVPGLYLSSGGTEPGRLFVPMFAATVVVGALPPVLLWRSRDAPETRERRRYLLLAALGMWIGSALVIALMLNDTFYPLGLYLLVTSLGILTFVAQADALPTFSRFVERSQRYALLAAMLSAVWMFLLLSVVQAGVGFSWEASLLLFVLTFTAQPLLTEARMGLTQLMFPGGHDGEGLTRALAASEARAAHAQRLAEIGTMASAVAHEVRNPLGVITACLAVLERQGADAGTLAEIQGQVDRAARFSEELLAYGRPAPLRRRDVQLTDVFAVAVSEVQRALPAPEGGFPHVSVRGDAAYRGDWAALVRLFAVLVDNAALSGASRLCAGFESTSDGVRVVVDDDGPGVPDAIADRLFAPFVSGRGRGGPRPGTGLGLAIAVRVAEQHGGTLSYPGSAPELGGARFVVALPALEEP